MIDRGHLVEYPVPDGDVTKCNERKGKLTMSNLGAAIGESLQFTTPEDVADDVLGLPRIDQARRTSDQQAVMDAGNRDQPLIQKWYENTFGVKVEIVGFGVPKWDERMGGTPDGLVGSRGMVEFKRFDKAMPYKLTLYDQQRQQGRAPAGYDHIFKTHILQMQGNLAVWDRDWCDYIGYCAQGGAFVQRVPRDRELWDRTYVRVKQFFDVVLPQRAVLRKQAAAQSK